MIADVDSSNPHDGLADISGDMKDSLSNRGDLAEVSEYLKEIKRNERAEKAGPSAIRMKVFKKMRVEE